MGIAQRDLEWKKAFEIQYLSVTSDVKIGVTREKQLLHRWIDQGALSAIALARTSNRYLAGIIKWRLIKVSDKISHQGMVKNIYLKMDLKEIKNSLHGFLPNETQKYLIEKNDIRTFTYPVKNYPKQIKNIHLKKNTYPKKTNRYKIELQ